MNYIEIEDLIITLNINDICTMIQCFLTQQSFKIYNNKCCGRKTFTSSRLTVIRHIVHPRNDYQTLFNICLALEKKEVENQIGPFVGADTTTVER